MGYTQTYSLEGNPEEIYAGFGRKCGGFGASPEGVGPLSSISLHSIIPSKMLQVLWSSFIRTPVRGGFLINPIFFGV